ncbi:MAG: pseudaminic acid synthase [Parachlamydiaceae bacterium]
MDEFQIGERLVGLCHPPFIVAEMSGNHKGSLQRALEIVDKAKQSGAHAIKLQTYTAETITLDMREKEFLIQDDSSLWNHRYLYDLYQEAYTPWEWHRPIFEYSKKIGLEVFSSPFDETAVDFLEDLNPPCYKIASPEIVDHHLIRKVAKTRKPLILSTGGATLAEIGEAVDVARGAGCRHILLLKCTAAYPAEPQDIHLRTLPHLAQSFGLLTGLSDHTLGIGVAIASVALGACLIEKHLTLSRKDGGIDSPFSMEPEELQALVSESKKAWESMGAIHYGPLSREKSTLSHRPSIYFIENLCAGTILEMQHVVTVRPAGGLPPKELPHILGLTLTTSVKKGSPVRWELFKNDAY